MHFESIPSQVLAVTELLRTGRKGRATRPVRDATEVRAPKFARALKALS